MVVQRITLQHVNIYIYIYASSVHTYTDAGVQTWAALSMASSHVLKFGRLCVPGIPNETFLVPILAVIVPVLAVMPFLWVQKISGPQKRPAERGPRKKTSKSVKNLFRHFSTFFAQDKNRQKVSKIFFDNFRAAPYFPAPFRGL